MTGPPATTPAAELDPASVVTQVAPPCSAPSPSETPKEPARRPRSRPLLEAAENELQLLRQRDAGRSRKPKGVKPPTSVDTDLL
ncbi:unnamed protein product [Callosobruchus maculatus]|uniref:Uncharacterized protein n=1 Tax=Callosobruchus maculatus TaxID=64391 RepID=A0A653CIJ8_CALMS|nr:unnamed protein product [Callosobruchus maculatus]